MARFAGGFAVALLALLGLCQSARAQWVDPAAALRARWVALQPQLRASVFGEPLHLRSSDGNGQVEGEVHAEVGQPFAEVAAVFQSARTVCALLFLHLNVRACHPAKAPGTETLTLVVGPKRAQASDTRFYMDYALRVEAATPAYLRVTLLAARGPLATHDYRIGVEMVPLDAGRSFVRLDYAYQTGALARMATDAYLATAGRAKIGFTIVGQDAQGQPLFVHGERAALERNVIRYFLALVATASVKAGPPQARMEARLRTWFALTERYAAQLHELDLDEYLQEKHDDLATHSFDPP